MKRAAFTQENQGFGPQATKEPTIINRKWEIEILI